MSGDSTQGGQQSQQQAYGGPYANSGLGRYAGAYGQPYTPGMFSGYRPQPYTPMIFAPPVLGPRQTFAPAGASPVGGLFGGGGAGATGGGGEGAPAAAPSNDQGATTGISGQAIGIGLSMMGLPPAVAAAIGQSVNGLGASSGAAQGGLAAAQGAANADDGVNGPGANEGGNANAPANDAEGSNAGDGGGGAGGK